MLVCTESICDFSLWAVHYPTRRLGWLVVEELMGIYWSAHLVGELSMAVASQCWGVHSYHGPDS